MRTKYTNTLWIPYTSQDFPSGTDPGTGVLEVTWHDLVWATLTVGRPNIAYVFSHGNPSYYEALFRLSLVWMALEQRPYNGWLHRTDAFKSLDTTEKGAVTYFLGMAVCKLFAHKLLSTPWLLHLDVFRDQLNPVLLRGRSRPDLVGQNDQDTWYAFECKGRSSVPTEDERRTAKTQAQRVVSVNSRPCSLHIGAISYFRQDTLEFHWRDPDPRDAQILRPIAVTQPDDAWFYYYAPALALATAEPTVDHAKTENNIADISIEIHDAILELLRAGEWTTAQMQARELRSALRQDGYYPDGLKIVAGDSWQSQL